MPNQNQQNSRPPANNTLIRHWHLLQKIPREPRKITVEELLNYLNEEHFDVTTRTIQRDLNKLSELFPIYNDEERIPGWSWSKSASAVSLPGLTASQALTFKLVKNYLVNLIPASVLQQLDPFFAAADKELLSLQKNPLHEWPAKIAVVPPTQPLLAPKIDATVQNNVSDALLNNRKLRLLYQNRQEETPSERIVHPLAMVARGGLLYLGTCIK